MTLSRQISLVLTCLLVSVAPVSAQRAPQPAEADKDRADSKPTPTVPGSGVRRGPRAQPPGPGTGTATAGGTGTAGKPAPGAPPAGSAADPGGTAGEDESLYNCGKAKGKFKVNLAPDVELKDLVTWAFSFTCKNFIYSSAIATRAAKVTIKSPDEMNARQAWRVFLVALQSMGLTVVPKGNILEIVEYAQAKTQPLPVYTKGRPAAADQMVRAVLRPDHLPPDEVANILNELKSKDGVVKAVPKAGVVVVTDFGTNISKMASLMGSVDTPVSGERLYMIRVKYADAAQLATTLTEILGSKEAPSGGGGGVQQPRARRGRRGGEEPDAEPAPGGSVSTAEVESAVPSKIMADERTNSLIVLASEPAYLRVKALVARLDVSVDIEGSGKIFVYPLENADAEEMSATLTAVISGVQQPSGGGGPTNRQGRQGREPDAPRQAPVPQSSAGEGAAAFEGQVRVTHDKPTNAIVVTASFKDFLALREVIRRLDIPRPQVYIEATIAEIGVDNGRNLGTAWHGGAEVGDGDLVLGGVQHTNLSSLNVATLATSTGLIAGALGHLLPGAEELLGQSIPSFGILFNALATTSNVNVLSQPHLLTTDNEEAEISVGQNIPYQSALVGGFGGQTPGGGFFPTQSIQRQDVELNLKITPQINQSDLVKLEIDLTINDIASQDFAGLGPSWSKRTLKDTVVVKDQQAVVLGGLLSDKVTHSESKVPLLGDIPVLGYLFKYTQKRKEKRNLLILLTPYIVKSQMDLEKIVERRVREQREFMRAYSGLAEAEYRPALDYQRKRGLVAEINKVMLRVEDEQRAIDELEQREIGLPDGPIEYFEVGPRQDAAGPEAPAQPDENP
ncbi:MAG TPA: type II secretion system secretin GspD [Kofleriaceae bacterium]|nr:type II secretion system secretin GspD [Kofleriaceae bacterium]